MKAAATLVGLPLRAGRRRLPAITPPQHAGRSRRHTHTLRNRLTCLRPRRTGFTSMKVDCRASCREALMQRDCVTNEAQAVRYRAVAPVCVGERLVKSCAGTASLLESISLQDFTLTNN